MSIINCARFDCSSQCGFEIAAWHDDERIASTQLKHTFLDVACGGAGDCASGFFTSGECDCPHPWIDNHLFHLLRFDQERLKNALVEAGSAKDLFNRERTLRNVGRVFQESHVSRQQGRRRKSKHLPERKIPGHDSENRPERFIMNVTLGCIGLRGLVFQESLSIFGVKPATSNAFRDLLLRCAKQFSHFQRHRAGQPVLFLLKQ